MKKIKILLTLIAIIFMTGCTTQYTIDINKNLQVTEKIEALALNSEYIERGTTNKIYIDTMYDTYKNNANYAGYTFNKIYQNQQSGMNIERKYENLEEYMDNTMVKKTLFGQIIAEEVDGVIYVSATDYRGDGFFDNDTNDFYRENAKIVIRLPFEVLENNADEYDIEKGEYIWNFTETTEDKEIQINFKKNIPLNKKIKLGIKQLKYIFAILIVLTLIPLLIYIKYKKVNKI